MTISSYMIRAVEALDPLLTVEDLADYLGVSIATLYQWRYRQQGPTGFRVGRHVRYRWADVEGWIEDQLQDASR
jgi:excisionase family DNA binding protein